MSSIGALASSFPSYFRLSPFAFRSLYLLYASVGLILFFIYMNLKHRSHKQEEGASASEGNGKERHKEALIPFLP
ncbi:MAG: hypothetical protein RXR51_03550 [Nitrososphaeria archaeon]